jgi:hypothetical protein
LSDLAIIGVTGHRAAGPSSHPKRTRVANEERHLALPKLYGAPAYARPAVVPIAPVDRPFDPDDLPLEALQTEEERDYVTQLAARPYPSAAGEALETGGGGAREGSPMLRGRPFRLGSITSKLRGDATASANGTNGSSGANGSNGAAGAA